MAGLSTVTAAVMVAAASTATASSDFPAMETVAFTLRSFTCISSRRRDVIRMTAVYTRPSISEEVRSADRVGRRRSGSDQAGAVGHDDGLDPVAQAQLGQDPGDVGLHGRLRQVQAAGQLGV